MSQMDADHFVPIFKAHMQESAVARDAFIVDHNIDRAHVFGDLRAKVFAGVKVAHVPFIISYAGAPGEGLRSFGITRIIRSEEHTSELQSLMRISYAVFCLKKNNTHYVHLIPLRSINHIRHHKSTDSRHL